MSLIATIKENPGLKVLSLLLAALLWFALTLGHNEETRIAVPVVLKNIPPHLVVAGAPPPDVELELSGPKILLMTIHGEHLPVILDCAGAVEGTVSFFNLDMRVHVRSGIRITRVQPATLDVRLVKTGAISPGHTGP